MKKLLFGLALSSLSCFAGAAPFVEFQTSAGKITVELAQDKAPKTVENFLAYAKSGFYDGTIFHRVIDGFMIQGGGFDARMDQKPTRAPIKNEADNGLKNLTGTIAMARTADPHSATAQFFINLSDNDFLNFRAPAGNAWGYAVFGKVTGGMDVVRKIAGVPTGNVGPYQNVPVTPVTIQSVQILNAQP